MDEEKKLAWQQYYAEHQEEIKKRSRERYHATKGDRSEEAVERHRQYLREYYQRNKKMWADRRRRLKDKINADRRKRYQEDESYRDFCKKQAQEWRQKNPSKAFAQDLATYGVSPDEFQELLEKQGSKCAICGSKQNGRRLSVDHCHETKTIRGLLCSSCNFGIGIFKDDVKLMLKAVAYLKRIRKKKDDIAC